MLVNCNDYRDKLDIGLRTADVIEFAPGIYTDIALTIERPITLIGDIGGGTIFQSTNLIRNGKAMCITAADVVFRHISFTGAMTFRGNGAGIRHEDGNLLIERCVFRNNQNSVLAAHAPTATVIIRDSTFIRNGSEDGHAHGLYVADPIARLVVENSVFVGTNTGHHLKSRAAETLISGCLFGDGVSRSASYAIHLPNGGVASISGNFFRKSPCDKHFAFINYGGEGPFYDINQLSVQNNDFIGRSWPPTVALLLRQRSQKLMLKDNRMDKVVLANAGHLGTILSRLWHGPRKFTPSLLG